MVKKISETREPAEEIIQRLYIINTELVSRAHTTQPTKTITKKFA